MLKLDDCIHVLESTSQPLTPTSPPSSSASIERLEALHMWLTSMGRNNATLSVGVVGSSGARRCIVEAHGKMFEALSQRGGFPGTWEAIRGALAQCEAFEETLPRAWPGRYGPGV